MQSHLDDSAPTLDVLPLPDECGASGCEPMPVMVLMACVLALFLVWLGLAALRRLSWRFVTLRTAGRTLTALVFAAAPTPPSLIALSISRT